MQNTNMATGYPFQQALVWLKGGRKLKRRGWNGAGMFIYLVRQHDCFVGETAETENLEGIYAKDSDISIAPRFDMRYANGLIGPWSPTHEDLLAEDWNILT